MSSVEDRDTLTISFTGILDDGTVFIEITADDPMTATIGDSELPPTVESALIGMQPGETRKIRVPPEEGYGPRIKDLLHEVPLKNFGKKFSPRPGMLLSQKVERDGVEQRVPATVTEVKDDSVVVDYNHPLAGHHLTYELTILTIAKAH